MLSGESEEGIAESREALPLFGIVGVIELKVEEPGLGAELEPIRLLGMPEVGCRGS
jgi:hypothetical protein